MKYGYSLFFKTCYCHRNNSSICVYDYNNVLIKQFILSSAYISLEDKFIFRGLIRVIEHLYLFFKYSFNCQNNNLENKKKIFLFAIVSLLSCFMLPFSMNFILISFFNMNKVLLLLFEFIYKDIMVILLISILIEMMDVKSLYFDFIINSKVNMLLRQRKNIENNDIFIQTNDSSVMCQFFFFVIFYQGLQILFSLLMPDNYRLLVIVLLPLIVEIFFYLSINNFSFSGIKYNSKFKKEVNDYYYKAYYSRLSKANIHQQ